MSSLDLLKKSLEFIDSVDELPSTSTVSQKKKKRQKQGASELRNVKVFLPKSKARTVSTIETYKQQKTVNDPEKSRKILRYLEKKSAVDKDVLKKIVNHFERPHRRNKNALKRAKKDEGPVPPKKKKKRNRTGKFTNDDFKAWAKSYSASMGVRT